MNKDKQLLNQYQDLLQNELSLDSSKLLQHTLNIVMRAEREIHNQKYDDKSNGFYSRDLGTPYGKIAVDVPRTRSSDVFFRPEILPNKYERNQQEIDLLLQALLTCNYSPNQIDAVLKKLGLSYSEKELKTLSNQILEEFNAWNQRPLQEDYLAIYIDAYNAETLIDNKVQNTVTFIVQSIDFNGHKDIIGTFFLEGSESKEYWLQVFNKLIHRGVKRPLFIITDDFSGVKNATEVIFPNSFHQLCLVHLKRNIRKNMAADDASKVNNLLSNLQNTADNFEQAKNQLINQLNQLKEKYPNYTQYLLHRVNNYLQFIRLNSQIRKYFCTTNTVESFNSILEKMRRKSGNFFQNHDVIKINIFINYKKLKHKWKNGIPLVKAKLYETNQLFVTQFNHLPNANTQHLG